MLLFSKISRLPLMCSVIFLIILSGCGGEPKPDGFPTLYPVSLQFMQEGKPCAEASVGLVPQDGSKWATGGSTDSNGIVTFKTHGKFPGVPEGKYKIVISKHEREESGPAPQSMYEAQKTLEVYDLIDPDYSIPEKTSLEIEIRPGKNSFDPFDLGKEIRQRVKKPGER